MISAFKIGARSARSQRDADVVLGEDWVDPENSVETELRAWRSQRGVIQLNRSPLARKIITFNLLALIVLVSGVLFLDPFRDGLLTVRAKGFVSEAELIANVVEAQFPLDGKVDLSKGQGVDLSAAVSQLDLADGIEVYVFDPNGNLLVKTDDRFQRTRSPVIGIEDGERNTVITSLLNRSWAVLSGALQPLAPDVEADDKVQIIRSLLPDAMLGRTRVETFQDIHNSTIFAIATPISHTGRPIGSIALTSPSGEMDALVRYERERILQMFVIALLVSIGLSLVLASTIANPLSDLAAAAELGRARDNRQMRPGRIRIPDLTARPDEIGRLSGAFRGMVTALYDRIEANEQFAADVAHEIKNPLASLRSAVGTLRVARKPEQQQRLLDVIDHDVRRLDRLVSDISNASRLDSELVKEQEETFDLLKMLDNLISYLGDEAKSKRIDFISDLPSDPIMIQGLEARLAQVFVNLITNAISFCEEGDAIRVWSRKRANRVLIVVEDTGPGIPDQALTKIFQRFYSERPEGQFGNNSGLGLAISKQIVEAHGGVIWAENIRPTNADLMSDPLGARFVVGLPI